MEQNKIDSSQIIGFLFLIAAFIALLMFQPQIEEPSENSEIDNESNTTIQKAQVPDDSFTYDNTNIQVLENEFITLENEDVRFTFSTKGAQISKSILKKHNDLDGNNLEIINNNQSFYFDFENTRLKDIDTSQMFFSYDINENNLGKEINFLQSIYVGLGRPEAKTNGFFELKWTAFTSSNILAVNRAISVLDG